MAAKPKPMYHNPDITIKSVIICEHYADVSHMMRLLHENEYRLFDKTAQWADIEANYMKHVVAMQKDCDGLCLMAMHGETPVGFIFGYLEEQDDSRIETYTGKQLYVSDGFVMPDYRHRGIYRQMNALLEQHYTDMGVKRFLRFTHIRNTGMRSLLEADGYFVSRLLYEKWL